MSARPFTALTLFAIVAAAAPAHAYVLTRTTSGTPVRWQERCIIMSPDARGDQSGDDISNDDIETTLQAAVDTWNQRIQTCGFLQLSVNPATQVLEAVSDGRPAVVFDSSFWGRDGNPYSSQAIAVTTVWYADHPSDPTDGLISDADIELNAVNYTFTTQPTTAAPRDNTEIADLQNTLTHELGHVMGLAHTCWDHKTSTPPPDNLGNPAPDCDLYPNLPAIVTNATMYPYTTMPGAINMRTVGDDDLSGICDSYPNTATPTACYGYIKSPGCAYAPKPSRSGAAWISLFVVLGVAGLWRAHRWRRLA